MILASPTRSRTVDDLLHELGDLPPSRVLMEPLPGQATLDDLIAYYARTNLPCELVDGTLVEKAMGMRESIVAGALLSMIRAFVVPRNLGIVAGEAGMTQLFAGLVRSPDVLYASWDRLPGRKI